MNAVGHFYENFEKLLVRYLVYFVVVEEFVVVEFVVEVYFVEVDFVVVDVVTEDDIVHECYDLELMKN